MKRESALRPQDCLIRLRPRGDALYISQSSTVFTTGVDGFVAERAEQGLFVHQTRLLSRYRYLIDNKPPRPVALSNVEQHSWLGYYMALPPGIKEERDPGSGHGEVITEQTLELRLPPYVADALHANLRIPTFSTHIYP